MKVFRVIAPLLLFSLALMITTSAIADSGPDEISGTIIKIYRDSYFWNNDSSEWSKIIEGMRVTRGHVLRTGGEATAVFEFDNNLVTLGPNTIIGLSDFTGKNVAGGLIDKWSWTSVAINLVYGEIFLKVKDQDEESTFKVISGLAVVETRGGEFSVKVEKSLMSADDPDRTKYLSEIEDVEANAKVVSGTLTTVVDKGSVTLVNIDTEGNIEGEPVEVKEGETSSIKFKYIRDSKNGGETGGGP